MAYQLPLAVPQLGRRVVELGGARLALRAASDSFTDDELNAFADRLTGDRARASELLYRTFLLRQAFPVAAGRHDIELQVPTLLLFGEKDLAIPTRVVREQAARADAIELELVAEAGHFIVDEKPLLVADRLLRFAIVS